MLAYMKTTAIRFGSAIAGIATLGSALFIAAPAFAYSAQYPYPTYNNQYQQSYNQNSYGNYNNYNNSYSSYPSNYGSQYGYNNGYSTNPYSSMGYDTSVNQYNTVYGNQYNYIYANSNPYNYQQPQNQYSSGYGYGYQQPVQSTNYASRFGQDITEYWSQFTNSSYQYSY